MGCDVNLQDKQGGTALMDACVTGHGNYAEQILKKGAKVNVQDHNGYTALHFAVTGGVHLFKPHLEAGADPNIANDRGNTPLHIICDGYFRPADLEKIEHLVKAQADLELQNKRCQTPLMLAANEGTLQPCPATWILWNC